MTFNAYAYKRVSTSIQDKEENNGLSHQQNTITDFLKQHPTFKLSDTAYTDKSSDLHGLNISDDAGLGNVISDCESGLIKAGDMLCIEVGDRISSIPPNDAKALFQRLLSYGVKVAIVKWGIVIDNKDNKLDFAAELLLTVGCQLSFMENEQKLQRNFSESHRNVIKASERVSFHGKKAPRWLALNKDQTKFIVKPLEVEFIERLFTMKASGMTCNKIITILHGENKLMLGGVPLRPDSITTLLQNRKLIGEWQPLHKSIVDGKAVEKITEEPIKGYFPSVIDEQLFNEVQASFNQPQNDQKTSKMNTIFSDLMRNSPFNRVLRKNKSYEL
ncbi:recombinase family protein [Colwellia sp. 75C3]|uniref:recombinase family protein n=1 Tax=Colwellia sp. 75C3 TaxID=888425 RepID=UPI0018E351C6|nr:recombinase family protein [Colwellia sp. 75C3]